MLGFSQPGEQLGHVWSPISRRRVGLELSGGSLAVSWLNLSSSVGAELWTRWKQYSERWTGLALFSFSAVSVGLQFTVSFMKSS